MKKLVYSAFALSLTTLAGQASESEWSQLDKEVEALSMSLTQDGDGPQLSGRINTIYANSSDIAVGADDLDKVVGDLAFRRAREGDDFYPLGAAPPVDDPPKAGEVVYADGQKLLCRRWNWYQDGRSATSLETRRAVLTVQWLGGGTALEPAIEELCVWLSDHCGARCAWAIAEAATPRAEVGLD